MVQVPHQDKIAMYFKSNDNTAKRLPKQTSCLGVEKRQIRKTLNNSDIKNTNPSKRHN